MSKLASAMMLWLSRGKAQTAAISKPRVSVESKVSSKERQNMSEDRKDKPEPEMYGEEEIILRGERDEVPFDQLPEEIREHYQKIPNWEYSTVHALLKGPNACLTCIPPGANNHPFLDMWKRDSSGYWSVMASGGKQ